MGSVDPPLRRRRGVNVLWTAAAPFRRIARTGWLPKGRSRSAALARLLVAPALDWSRDIAVEVPGGATVSIPALSMLGRIYVGFGAFESVELQTAVEWARHSTTVFDVGANVGIFTAALSRTVGPDGHVVSIEPLPETAEILKRNAQSTGIQNVTVIVAAADAADGLATLNLADDNALHTLGWPIPGHPVIGAVEVATRTLDGIWAEAGYPIVSFLKIDVEGAEARVLRGARQLLDECRPALLVEAHSPDGLAELLALAGERYGRADVRGFDPWNHLLIAQAPSSTTGRDSAL